MLKFFPPYSTFFTIPNFFTMLNLFTMLNFGIDPQDPSPTYAPAAQANNLQEQRPAALFSLQHYKHAVSICWHRQHNSENQTFCSPISCYPSTTPLLPFLWVSKLCSHAKGDNDGKNVSEKVKKLSRVKKLSTVKKVKHFEKS